MDVFQDKRVSQATVFLDRDGVLNVDSGYVHRLQDLHIPEGTGQALVSFQKLGLQLIVITNQSGVARGMFDLKAVEDFHAELRRRYWEEYKVSFKEILVCPHHEKGIIPAYAIACNCRKPKTGLLEQAMQRHPIDLKRSFMVGDKKSDIDCGKSLSLKTIQVVSDRYNKCDYANCHVERLDSAVPFVAQHLASNL